MTHDYCYRRGAAGHGVDYGHNLLCHDDYDRHNVQRVRRIDTNQVCGELIQTRRMKIQTNDLHTRLHKHL